MKESLPVAATSLDVSAKVYGVKVDDAHSYAMQLATGMVAKKNKNAEEENGNCDKILNTSAIESSNNF